MADEVLAADAAGAAAAVQRAVCKGSEVRVGESGKGRWGTGVEVDVKRLLGGDGEGGASGGAPTQPPTPTVRQEPDDGGVGREGDGEGGAERAPVRLPGEVARSGTTEKGNGAGYEEFEDDEEVGDDDDDGWEDDAVHCFEQRQRIPQLDVTRSTLLS